MSIPVITLTSAPKTSVSGPPDVSKRFQDASFSSFLDGGDETFVLKLGGAGTQGVNASISTPHDHVFLAKTKAEETEIDVFNAEKYFNEGLSHSPIVNHSPKIGSKSLVGHHQQKRHDPLEIFAVKERPSIGARSIRSESSWNSRIALLHTVPRNQQRRKANKKSLLASIGCNCSCADKNSVDIDDYTDENKSKNTGLVNGKSKQGDQSSDHLVRKSQSDHSCVQFDGTELRLNSEDHFSFPVFNSKTGNQAAKMQVQEEDDSTAKRKSLEVFGSPILESGKNSLSLEKKLTVMATWDAIAAEEIKIPSISSEMHNDSDSDASSDLFEIESFSKGNPFLSRQESDGLSGCLTPTTCYAPSEASIEWSVVTASAADFSVLSDSEELRPSSTTSTPHKVGLNSKIPKLRSSILSGCKSQKAVRVAGDVHRANEQGFSNARRQLQPVSFTTTTRFHNEHKLDSFDARRRQKSFDERLLSRSQSGSATHLLYT
ncbi:UNVERIFIED_CONTAM: protein PHYTOCHROME KINASE SUBSTRATE 1 [Sesamum calycinum]|uniref:Protein PHYTOCHROME KINASE SUBSTRATE 1 n=1 Tax=Sesamum calycinum TaxID=2727403 RepID=A0AAW2PR67_9LAMI